MTAFTSRLGYQETISEREVQSIQLLGLYLSGPLSDREAGKRMNLPPSQVSARRSDLMKQGKVRELGRKKDENTGKLVNVWGIVRETLFD